MEGLQQDSRDEAEAPGGTVSREQRVDAEQEA
jgi:hypothetical protein